MICALTHPALPLVENSCALVENIEDAWEELPFLNNFVMASYWFKVTAGLSLDDAFFFTSINSKRKKKKKTLCYVSEDDATSRYSSTRSQYSEIGNSFAEDRETDGMLLLLF